MSATIRAATPEDIPLVLRFIRSLAEYEKTLDEVEATEERLRAQLFPANGTPVAHCVLAFAPPENGRPAEAVGFALYFFNFSTFLAKPGLYLEDLFVDPEMRGGGIGVALMSALAQIAVARGYGKALLLHLARLANERGCGRMEWTVLDWNEPAIAFYESLGARRLREWQICRLVGPSLTQYA